MFPAPWLQNPPSPLPRVQHPVFSSGLPTVVEWKSTLTVDALPVVQPINVLTNTWSGTAWVTRGLNQISPNSSTKTNTVTFTNSLFAGGSPLNGSFEIANFDSQPTRATLQIDMFCTSPTAPNSPCCPPDPLVSNYLNQILNLEQLIYQKLEQAAPVAAYKRGTVHSGRTGTGTITVSGLFGVLIEITQGVPTDPLLPGVPPYQWSVGWCSVLTGDGMIDEIRITRQAQVWASRLAPYATTVGYQINAAFVANITELLPV